MWEIKDKNGFIKAIAHKLEYTGEWMGERYVTVTIESPTPIDFVVGDYLLYRGERFEINYDPAKTKKARQNTIGSAFTYDDIKFNSLADELTRCEFLDVVLNDNELHFTGLPKVDFYGTVRDLADRIQANLNRVYKEKPWKVVVSPEFTGDETLNVSADNIKVSGALEILVNDFEVYYTIHDRTITIGAAAVPAGHIFKFGKDNGLYEVKQTAESDQAIVTRLRAYGSTTNLPHRYYNKLKGVEIHTQHFRRNVVASPNDEGYTFWYVSFDMDYYPISTAGNKYHPFRIGEQVLNLTISNEDGWAVLTNDTSSAECANSRDTVLLFDTLKVLENEENIYYVGTLEVPNLPEKRDVLPLIPNNMAVNFLMLPEFPFYTQDPYIDSENAKTIGIREGSIFFDGSDDREDIYPTIEGMTAEQLTAAGVPCKATGALDELSFAEEITDDGVGEINGNNSELSEEDAYFYVYTKDIGFDVNDYLTAESPTISFKTGKLAGREFEIFKVTKIEGSAEKMAGYEFDLKRVYDDDVKLWFPYKDYNAARGDKFVLLNIDMPEVYIRAASQRLKEAAEKWLADNDYSRSVYSPAVDELFMARQHDQAMASNGTVTSLHDTICEGMQMLFEDSDLGIDGAIAIDRLVIKEKDKAIPTYEVTLKEEKTVGTLQKIKNQVDSLVAGKGQGNGYTAQQLRSMIKAVGAENYLSKLNPDIAKGLIQFLDGITFGGDDTNPAKGYIDKEGDAEFGNVSLRKSVTIGDYTPNTRGAAIRTIEQADGTTVTEAEVDRLWVRIKAYFEELVISKVRTMQGENLITPGGGIDCTLVEKSANGWKCYFTAEQDGTLVGNPFVVGDMAKCQTFNLKAGEHSQVGNKFYWRKVLSVGEDWIELSELDCAELSDEPAMGDSIVQLGNATLKERQTAIIISTVNHQPPSINLYTGIDTYSLDNCDVITMGYDSVSERPFMNVYGNCFIGSRDKSEFFDFTDGKSRFKGAIEASSTVDGRTLEEFVATKGKGYTPNLLGGTPNGAANWGTSCYTNSESDDDTEAVVVNPWSISKPYMANGYTGIGLTVGGLGLVGCVLYFRSLGWPVMAGKTYTLSFILTSAYDIPELWVYIGRAAGWGDAIVPHKKLTIDKGTNRQVVQFTTTDAAATVGSVLNVVFNFQSSFKDFISGSGIEVSDLKLEENVNDNPAWTPAATDLVGAQGPKGEQGEQGIQGNPGENGKDGDSPYTLSLDRPNSLMSFDAGGDIAYDPYPTCKAKVLWGNKDKTNEWTFKLSAQSGGSFELNGNAIHLVEFASPATDSAKVTVTATKNNEEPLSAEMAVYKVKNGPQGIQGPQGTQGIQGVPGADSVIYALIPSATFVRKGFDGVLDPPNLFCQVLKIQGATRELSGDNILKYKALPDGTETTWAHPDGLAAAIPTPATATAVELTLTDGTMTLAQARIPVLTDAEDIREEWNNFQTDYNGMKSEVGSLTNSAQKITTLEQTSESISLKVSDTPISRNMLGGTNKGRTGWTTRATLVDSTAAAISPWDWERDSYTDSGPGVGVTVGGNELQGFDMVFKSTIDATLKADKTYTLSFVSICGVNYKVQAYLCGAEVAWAAMITNFAIGGYSKTEARHSLVLTAKKDYTGPINVVISFGNSFEAGVAGVAVGIGDLQLESGNIPSQYSKAESDLRRQLLDTGIDITSGKVTVTADKFVVNGNDGVPISLIQRRDDGTPMIAGSLLSVNSVEVYNPGSAHDPDFDIAMSINRKNDGAYTIYQDGLDKDEDKGKNRKVPMLRIKVAYVDERKREVIDDPASISDFTDTFQSVMQYYNRDGKIRWYLGPDGIVQLEQSSVTWTYITATEMDNPRTAETLGISDSTLYFYRCEVPGGMQQEEEWADKNGLAVMTASVDGDPVPVGTYYALQARRLYYIPKTTASNGITSAYWGWVWARTRYRVTEDEETGDTYVTSSEIQWVENEAPAGGVIDR